MALLSDRDSIDLALVQLGGAFQSAVKEKLREALEPVFEEALEAAFNDVQLRLSAFFSPVEMSTNVKLELSDKREKSQK